MINYNDLRQHIGENLDDFLAEWDNDSPMNEYYVNDDHPDLVSLEDLFGAEYEIRSECGIIAEVNEF